MNPADATPAWSVVEPAHESTLAGGLQPFTQDISCHRRIILVCDGDKQRRERHRAALTERGHEVVTCDPMQPYTFTSFEQLLAKVAVVRFDCSVVNLDAVKRLLHVAAFRQRHGMKPFFVCTAIDPHQKFKNHLHHVLKVDRTVDPTDQSDRLHASFNPMRWGVQIAHRWWVGETICTPGEELYAVNVFNNQQIEPVPLGMKDGIALDQIARGKVPQSGTQWAESMNASAWVIRHGSRARPPMKRQYRFNERALKQSIWRLRSTLSSRFEKVGVKIAPDSIIESIPCGREVKYRWNPQIFLVWDHIEC